MKYKVIYQFNDKETLESRMPGDIIELPEKRAKEILEAGPFIEKVDEPDKEDDDEKSEDSLPDEEETDEKSEDSSPDEEKTSAKSQGRKTSAKAKAAKTIN